MFASCLRQASHQVDTSFCPVIHRVSFGREIVPVGLEDFWEGRQHLQSWVSRTE